MLASVADPKPSCVHFVAIYWETAQTTAASCIQPIIGDSRPKAIGIVAAAVKGVPLHQDHIIDYHARVALNSKGGRVRSSL